MALRLFPPARSVRTSALGAALLLLLVTPGLASRKPVDAKPEVKVEKVAPVVVRRTFDPKARPKDMPKLKPGEAAVTDVYFNCSTNATYAVAEEGRKPSRKSARGANAGENGGANGKGCRAKVAVHGVMVKLELRVTIWLPTDATEKLTAHEEGHRQLAEQVYATAEAVARAEAQKLAGRVLNAEGATCEEAAKSAVQAAMGNLSESYLKQTAQYATRAGEIYDDLTDHGRKKSPAEEEAIRRAFQKAEEEAGK